MKVEVVYDSGKKQVLLTVKVADGANVKQAILASNVLAIFPELDFANLAVGIFSQRCELETTLREGDRIEIYRPLDRKPYQIASPTIDY